jgi:large subunit ribosomal protein L18
LAQATKAERRAARHKRLRKRVAGTAERPRLAVFRSLRHIYAQVIDDSQGVTLCAASTLERSLGAQPNVEGAKAVGAAVGKRALEKGIKKLVFDRGGFRYHGCVASLADGVREAGVEV